MEVREDGSYTLTIPQDKVARARAMLKPVATLEAQRDRAINEAFPSFLAKDAKTGRPRRIRYADPGKEAQMAQAGVIRAHVRHGGVRCVSDSAGYLWRVVGGVAEPLHRRRVGVFEKPDPNCACTACVGEKG